VRKPLFLGMLLIVTGLLPLGAANFQIVVIQENVNSYFEKSNSSLKHKLGNAFHQWVINADSVDGLLQKLKPSNIVIKLDIEAALKIASNYGTKNSLSTYITLDQQHQHETKPNIPNVVSLDQQLSRYLAFTALILQQQSVGITSSDPLVIHEEQHDVFSGINFNCRQYEFQKKANQLTRVKQLLKNYDAHLLLPDASVYNNQTLKSILLRSCQNKKFVVNYLSPHVKADELAPIFSSYIDIGSQLTSDIKHSIVKRRKSMPIIRFSQNFLVEVNSKIAYALGSKLPDKAKLTARLNELSQ
jgi:hypothetical protein